MELLHQTVMELLKRIECLLGMGINIREGEVLDKHFLTKISFRDKL